MLPASVYQFVFEHSSSSACLLSPSDDPVILAVNAAFVRTAGRPRDSMVGKALFSAFPEDPQDTGDSGMSALRGSLARAIATRQADTMPLQRYPIRVERPDGTVCFEERFWRAVNTPIFDAAGKLACILHRTEDVTQQWRMAQALRHNTERQSFQLALSDRLRPLTSPQEIATTAAGMLGEKLQIARVTYVEVDDATGTFVQRHWISRGRPPPPPDDARRLDDFGPGIVATLRKGEPLVICDVQSDPRTRAHADAFASIDVRSSVAIPLVKSGKLILVLSLQHDQPREWSEAEIELATDVAERTWSAAEAARAQQALRDASRRKDEFLAMLSHELRNPLAPISVAAELLARHKLDEKRLHMTSQVIARQVRHMTALVDDLMDVSRVTRGLVAIQESPLDMNLVVANAVEQVTPLIEAQQHQLTLDTPPAPASVCGDAKRLVQVVSNLLHNAAKYTPSGGQIRVAVQVEDENVQVQVEDNGIGIAPSLQGHIFELFAQAERSPDRSLGGLGLGLALVRSLVELHHGTVRCHSEGPGRGSCFTVTLPRLPGLQACEPGDAPDATQQATTSGLDVLVVDDNVDAAEMIRLLLESAGHQVRVEHDPNRALERAAAQPPQVALIDIGLPTMDGYELVRRLRSQPCTAGAAYIALTGYGQEADRSLALAAGFDEHLVKPADPERLLRLLETVPRR